MDSIIVHHTLGICGHTGWRYLIVQNENFCSIILLQTLAWLRAHTDPSRTHFDVREPATLFESIAPFVLGLLWRAGLVRV